MARYAKSRPKADLTPQQLDDLLNDYSVLEAKRNQASAKMEEKLTKVREQFADQLDELSDEMQQIEERIETWATVNYEKQFSDKRSLSLTHGIIGFKTNPPRVEKDRKMKWDQALEILKGLDMPQYITVKESPNKDRIIADKDELESAGVLDKIKCSVVQHETFYLKTKAEKESK